MKTRVVVATGTIGLLMLALIAAPAHAQDQVGVKGGITFSNVKFSEDTSAGVTFGQRIGMTGGMFFVTDVSKPVSLQPEILFSMKGAKIDFGSFDDDAPTDAAIHLSYIEVPLLVRFNATRTGKNRLYLAAGPALGILLKATAVAGSESEDIDDTAIFELGLALGAGVDLGRFVLDARYTWGMTDAGDGNGDDSLKNRTLAVTVGVRIK